MVIGLLLLTAIPTVTGVSLSVREQQNQADRKKDEERMQKFHIDAYCDANSSRLKEINGGRIVLKDERVWIGPPKTLNPSSHGYVAEAFYIEYPDKERIPVPLGLVSQVQADPPLLNWLYIDKDTMELRYGNKTKSCDHNVGPWDWTDDRTSIMFDGEELFTAVENAETGRWQIYHDTDDDGLKSYVPKGTKTFHISLERKVIAGASTPSK